MFCCFYGPEGNSMRHQKYFFIGLLALNLFIILFWYVSFHGFFYYDDITYARYAHHLTQGSFEASSDHFAHRFGLIFPVALIYEIFGVSPYSSVLLPLVSILIVVNGIFLLGFRMKREKMALLAAVFTGLNFYVLYFTKYLYPDIVVMAGVFLSVWAIYEGRATKNPNNLWAYIAVLSLFWAFCVKETAVLAVFFPLFVFFRDIKDKVFLKFWKPVLIISLVLLTAYLAYYQFAYGNFFYRFQIIVEEAHYVAADSYFDKDMSVLWPRITYLPMLMLINSGLAIPILFSLTGYLHTRKQTNFDYPEVFWFWSGVFVLVAFWGISTSWKYYNPLALYPRHLLMIVPLFAVSAAFYLSKATKAYYLKLGILLLFSTILCYFSNGGKIVAIYALLSVWSLLMAFFPVLKIKKLLRGSLLLILILMIHPLYHMWKGEEKGFSDTQFIIEKYFPKGNQKAVIYTDEMQAYGGDIFFRFEDVNVRFEKFDALKNSYLNEKVSPYLLWNDYHFNYLRIDHKELVKSVSQKGLQIELLEEKGMVKLYKLKPSTVVSLDSNSENF
jgi:4-amino-4-deoxy-L-arabinose transferase-like glycosyltransferase